MLLVAVVEQDAGAIAAIVGFADLALPFAVAALQLDGGLLHHAPAVGEQLFADDSDLLVHVRNPPMEPAVTPCVAEPKMNSGFSAGPVWKR